MEEVELLNIGLKNDKGFLEEIFLKLNLYLKDFKFEDKIFFILFGLSIWGLYVKTNYEVVRMQEELSLPMLLTIISSVIFYFIVVRYPQWRKSNQLRNSYVANLLSELADVLLECEERQRKIIEINQKYNVVENMSQRKGSSINDIISYALKEESFFLEKCDWTLWKELNHNIEQSSKKTTGKISDLYKKIKWASIDISIYRFLDTKDLLIINSIFEKDEITLIKYLGERLSSCKEEFKVLDVGIEKNINTSLGEQYRSLIVAIDLVRNIRGFEQQILRNLEEKRQRQ